MANWDREDVWGVIRVLSDMRAQYDKFNESHRPKYRALCLAILALREVIGEPVKGLEKDDKVPSVGAQPTDDEANSGGFGFYAIY